MSKNVINDDNMNKVNFIKVIFSLVNFFNDLNVI